VSAPLAHGAFDVVAAASVAAREVAPGFRIRELWARDGRKAQLIEMDPGAEYPGKDLHEPGPEEVFVVAGTFHDGVTEHPAGTFLHCPRGSWHRPGSRTGGVLFLFYPEG
jgi:hypothetical protein